MNKLQIGKENFFFAGTTPFKGEELTSEFLSNDIGIYKVTLIYIPRPISFEKLVAL